MEQHVFRRPEVVRELKKLVEVRMHTDRAGKESLELKKERFNGNAALPHYEIVDPVTGERLGEFLGGDPGGQRFAEFLRKHTESAS